MSVFTIKRHLLFLRVVCVWFVLYNILAAFGLSVDDRGLPGTWLAIGGIVGFILRLTIYVRAHLWFIFMVGVFHLGGIIAAIGALTMNERGRSWMVRLFYVTITIAILRFLSETAMVYSLYTTSRWKECKLGDKMLYVFIFHQSIYTAPIFVVILFWIIKQFKSQPIKNLFQQKKRPGNTRNALNMILRHAPNA